MKGLSRLGGLLLAAGAAAVAATLGRGGDVDARKNYSAQLVAEAERQRVDPRLVLATSEVEASFQNKVGDKHLGEPVKWAYGPLQARAIFWMEDLAPAAWTNPRYNIPAGVRAVKWALRHSGGNPDMFRLVYVRGRGGAKKQDERRARIMRRWQPVARRYGLYSGFPPAGV